MRLAAAVPHLPALLVTLTCDPAGISGSQSRIELSSLGQALCLVEPHLAGAQLQSAVDAHDLQLAVLDGLPATGRHGGWAVKAMEQFGRLERLAHQPGTLNRTGCRHAHMAYQRPEDLNEAV